jgi:4-oxalocrotonate tautomerase
MPLINIHLTSGKPQTQVQAIMDGVHEALVKAWKIPLIDRFQMVTEHKKEYFHFDKTIWGVKRSDDVIVIYITSILRSEEMKKELYRELAKTLSEKANIRKEDLFVSIVTVEKEDWSFGNGIAQLLDPAQKP